MVNRILSIIKIKILWPLILVSFAWLPAHALANSKVNRIVALSPHIVELLFDIGVGNKIVATVDFADYPAAAASIPKVGGNYGIQLEQIVALNPDLIIVWQNGNRQSDIERIKALGLPLAYSNTLDIHRVGEELRHLGQLTESVAIAEQKADEYEQALAQIKQRYQNSQPISVFYQLWPEPLMTVAKNTSINQMLELCGAVNIFADAKTDYPQVSLENVIKLNPQIILAAQEQSETPQPIIDWSRWQEISAVHHNAIIAVDADLLHRFSRRSLTGIADMCDKIDQVRRAQYSNVTKTQ